MKAKLSIDARWLVGGIGAYTRHLLEGLSHLGNGLEVHAIAREQNRAEVTQWCSHISVVNTPIYRVREQWQIPQAAFGCDLLHVPHFNAPLLQRTPVVITIHDVIPITSPESRNTLKARAFARLILSLAARKARHIMTVSEFSKAQIVERLGVAESKVSVILRHVTAEFSPMDKRQASGAVSQALGIDEPYVLYVGAMKRYKNVSCLLKAFAMLRKEFDIPHRLVIVGYSPDGGCDLAPESIRLGIDARTDFVSQAPQDLMPKIYAAADVLVMPSKIEGFGLPVLEAMACGTPVVCSRSASLPEVGGDAVIYFDAESPEDLAGALGRVLNSSELQGSLSSKGLQRAAQFTWNESVRRHVQVYESVLRQ